MKKIRIIHIINDFLNGGIESFLYYLIKEQVKNPRLHVTILCCQEKEGITNTRITKVFKNIIFIKIKPFDLSVKKYIKILKICNNYDVIHYQSFKPILSLFLQFSKSKKIFTIHSAGDKLRKKSDNFQIKKYLFKYFLNHMIDYIVNNSEYTKNFWINNGIRITNNLVIYNGVPELHAYNKDNCFKEYPQLIDKFIIGTTSRLIKWKRVDFLIKAFSIIVHEIDAMLLIVGDGPENENLRKMAVELNIEDYVVFTGYKKNVTDYQLVMNICVFPSVSEPFGLVAIECMMLGKPVLTMCDGGGITEIIKTTEFNHISESFIELANNMYEIYNNYSEYEKLSGVRISHAKKYSVVNSELSYFMLYEKNVKKNEENFISNKNN